MLFSYLMRMTGDYYLASDIMQESFTRYLECYPKQIPNASLLFTIARNAIFDHSRTRGRNTRLEKDPVDVVVPAYYLNLHPGATGQSVRTAHQQKLSP